jgi:hypothetical protein
VVRQSRTRMQSLIDLEELENLPDTNTDPDRTHTRDRLLQLIQQLKPLDRHVILSYSKGSTPPRSAKSLVSLQQTLPPKDSSHQNFAGSLVSAGGKLNE